LEALSGILAVKNIINMSKHERNNTNSEIPFSFIKNENFLVIS